MEKLYFSISGYVAKATLVSRDFFQLMAFYLMLEPWTLSCDLIERNEHVVAYKCYS